MPDGLVNLLVLVCTEFWFVGRPCNGSSWQDRRPNVLVDPAMCVETKFLLQAASQTK